ncbi:MAG TPA: hypothetical protein VFE98_06575 [Candidatus Bathyarchaeia archaeon]|nr:hypothetical protein [Candidatus Bathyarchaeia archaeon]
MVDPVVSFAQNFTLIGVLVAFIIFARLALKAGSIGAFRFQLSAFIILWVIAEIPYSLSALGYIDISSYQMLGTEFHVASMMAFALFVGIRSYNFVKHKPGQPSTPTVAPSTSTSPFRQEP